MELDYTDENNEVGYESFETETFETATSKKGKLIAFLIAVTIAHFGFAMVAMAQSESTELDEAAAQTTTSLPSTSLFQYEPGPSFSYGSDTDVNYVGSKADSFTQNSTTFWAKSPYARRLKLALGVRVSGQLDYTPAEEKANTANDVQYRFFAVRAGYDLYKSPTTNAFFVVDARFRKEGLEESDWQSFAVLSYESGDLYAEFSPGIYAFYKDIDTFGYNHEIALKYNFNPTIGMSLRNMNDHSLNFDEVLFGPAIDFNITPLVTGFIFGGNDFAQRDGEFQIKLRLEGSI